MSNINIDETVTDRGKETRNKPDRYNNMTGKCVLYYSCFKIYKYIYLYHITSKLRIIFIYARNMFLCKAGLFFVAEGKIHYTSLLFTTQHKM
jgi:hypothetical protein